MKSIILSLPLFLFASQTAAQTVVGDCNVVLPSTTAVADVSYSINCHGLSGVTQEKIARILQLLENTVNQDDAQSAQTALDALLASSEAALIELRRSRAPQLDIEYAGCSGSPNCQGELLLVKNVGGLISGYENPGPNGLETYNVLEVGLRNIELGMFALNSGVAVSLEPNCPFPDFTGVGLVSGQNSRHTVFVDFWPYRVGTSSEVDEGGTVIEMRLTPPNDWAIEAQSWGIVQESELTIESILHQMNLRLNQEGAPSLSIEQLTPCTTFVFHLGWRIPMISYTGSLVTEFLLLDIGIDRSGRGFVIAAGFGSESDFIRLRDLATTAGLSRITDVTTGANWPDFAFAAKFLAETYFNRN